MSGALQRALAPVVRAMESRGSYDIGMHIGLERLNLVQLQPGEGRPVIRAAASIAHRSSRDALIANPRALAKLIRRAWGEQPFRGRRVVTCLPSEQVSMLLLNYSVAEGASEPEAVVRELRERVKEELDGMVVDYIPVRQEHPSRPREAIVAMAPRAGVIAFLDALADAGLEVASLDVAPAALARLLSWIDPAGDAACPNLLMISLGSHSSYLTVVWERRLMLDRPVEFAEQRLLARLKNILDIAEPHARRLLLEHGLGRTAGKDGGGAEGDEIGNTLKEVLRPEFLALKAEVANTLSYTASRTHGRSVDGIYVVGGIARYPGIEQLLQEQFSVPLKVFDPCAVFSNRLNDHDLSLLRPQCGVAAAAGLALRGVPVSWPTSI